MKYCGILVVLAMVSMAIGCGGPAAAPAGGTVTYKGQPVVDATVLFTPSKGGEGSSSAHGKTDAQGKFTLTTNAPNDGAIPGDYEVGISPATPQQAEGDYSAPPPPPFPEKYMNGQASGLTATVVAGNENQFTLELKDE